VRRIFGCVDAGMRVGAESLGAGMRIALIGTGKIGGALGQKWQQAGHDVTYGSRNPRTDGPGGAPVATVGEAIDGAEVVVFARRSRARSSLTRRTAWVDRS
jgi:predicted dinucleotide-binding enzyme